jgi:hypothetical protein
MKSLILALSFLLLDAVEGISFYNSTAIDEPLLCRFTITDTMWEPEENFANNTRETSCIPIFDGREGSQLIPIPLPEEIKSDNLRALTEGRLLVSIKGASIKGYDELVLVEHPVFTVINDVPAHLRHLQILPTTKGKRKLLIVRVSTLDSEPVTTLRQLKRGLFKGNGPNMKTQYSECSFGKLDWELAGALNIKLKKPIANYTSGGALVSEATAKLLRKLKISSVYEVTDNVMFCVAPGTPGWMAVAAVNHWRSAFQDGWCLSLSTTMHGKYRILFGVAPCTACSRNVFLHRIGAQLGPYSLGGEGYFIW